MMFWSNLIGYQVVWFIAVIGAAHGRTWPALLGGLVFVASQIALADKPSVELRLLAMAHMDWARYAAPSPALPSQGSPVWILVLWSCFAMTINRSLAYLRDRWWLALAFGAIGAPLAYLGAQRGWQAVDFQSPTWRGLLWLSVGWAIALPSLTTFARRLCLNAPVDRGASEATHR
jgi:hypothetical protein